MIRLIQDKENEWLPPFALEKIYSSFAVLDDLDDMVYRIYAKDLESAQDVLRRREGNGMCYYVIEPEQ